ncbi:MAG: phosphotransferase [Woeseiaceae bacterium]
MTDSLIPDKVVDRLPEWRGATCTELGGGLTNRVWLLQKNDRKAVLKVDDDVRGLPFNTRKEEAVVQASAASVGLANPVLFASEQVYLTEYIDGSRWDPVALDLAGKTEQLASSLRRIHALPRTGRSFDAAGAANEYAQNIVDPDRELVSLCLRSILDVRLPNYLCCCHNDLVAENILATPSLKFLDWEYACDNDPMFDLATIVEHHELTESQAFALLDAYFEGAGEQWRVALAAQQRVYLSLHYLWKASRGDTSQKSLTRLGERLTTNCS